MTEKAGSLKFEVDARHVSQLGQQLVADRITALSELIKNAFDADATQVEVVLGEDAVRPGGSLEVHDDGHGMTLDDIRSKWMRISTDHKEANSTSPRFDRSRAGRKGIGRFAVERLGRRLVLSSSVKGHSERVVVTFDWDKEYTPGTNLSSIENPYRVESADEHEYGTSLFIEGLHDRWTDEDVKRVQKAVLLIQPPFPMTRAALTALHKGEHQIDPGFAVNLTRGGRRESADSSGLQDFLDAATAVIEGEVDERGKGVWRTQSDLLGLDDQQEVPDDFLIAGPFSFRAFYFVYTRGAIGSVTMAIAQQMSKEYGGVRLYRDGLRILPYGERGDDWLSLDAIYRRRSNVLAPIGNNNFFGQVFVSRDDNVLLVDTASREGVIENEAFRELREFVSNGLVWGVQRVASVRQKQKAVKEATREPPTRTELIGRASEALDAAQSAIAATGAATEAGATEEMSDTQTEVERARQDLVEIQQDAERADQEERLVKETLLGEIELYRIMASLGTSIALFSHEVRGILNLATAPLFDLEYEANKAQLAPGHSLFQQLVEAQQGMEQLGELSSFIDVYASESGRRQKQPQPLSRVLQNFLEAYSGTLNKQHVGLSFDVKPSHLRTKPMARSELLAILINFLTNALKAMDREGQRERRIAVNVREDGDEIVLKFQDSGTGIDESIRDRIFDPFITTPRLEADMLGTGTGLGLKVVRDIAEVNGGSVGIGAPDHGYTTCFELRLPAWRPDANSANSREQQVGIR